MSAPTRVIHKSLASDRWATFSFDEQMGHIGSEVERTIRAHKQGLRDRFDSAMARALELFDLTATDDRWGGPRLREVLRAREEFCGLFSDDAPERSTETLKEYFLEFAIAAREEKSKNRKAIAASDIPE